MSRIDIATDREGGRMTVTDADGTESFAVGRDLIGRAIDCGEDVALAILAESADGHGLDILQAAASRRDEVRLDGRDVNLAVLRWALGRPGSGRGRAH